MKFSPGMSKTTLILIMVVIILVATIGIAAVMLILTKEPLTNNTTNNTNITGNFTPQSTTTNNQTTSSGSTGSSDIQSSSGKGLDLSGYHLVDVRRSSETGNVRCQFCGEWTVQRTVYEYENSAGEMIMIGENYCAKCSKTGKDFWQKGVWSNL